jgi:hypothetical protein
MGISRMNWQSIDTAPKDGTVILAVTFEHYGGGEIYPHGGTMQYEGGEGRVLSGAWAYTGFMVTFPEKQPTHWMPLPEPPA